MQFAALKLADTLLMIESGDAETFLTNSIW